MITYGCDSVYFLIELHSALCTCQLLLYFKPTQILELDELVDITFVFLANEASVNNQSIDGVLGLIVNVS
jgi:hypothetical protein